MIVQTLRVKNWRRFRDEHEFEFGPGVNLLVGPNEAGKSTLFEVLQRTLFDRHTGTSNALEAMRPHESSLNPEAAVVLEGREDERLRIEKRFLGREMAEFSRYRGGEWRREADGDAAEENIRGLFEASLPGRGVTKPEHRGLAQALWYLQGEALPDESWHDAVQNEIREIDGAEALPTGTPREDAIVAAIREERDEFWTPTGRSITVNSELGTLEKETLPELDAEIDELEAKLAKVEENRGQLRHLVEDSRQKEEALEQTRERIERLRESLEDWEEDLERLDDLQDEIESECERRAELEEELATLDRLSEERDELADEIEEYERQKVRLEAEKERLEDRIQETDGRRKDEVKPDKREAERRAGALEAEKQRRELKSRLEALESEREKRTELEEAIEAHREELSRIDPPSEEELRQFADWNQTLEVTRAEADASAIEVTFDLDREHEVTADADADSEGTYHIVRPTTFEIENVGRMSVEGGGRDLEELQEEIDRLDEEIDGFLARYEVQDASDLREKRGEADEVERNIENLEQRLEDVDTADELAEQKQTLRSRMKSRAAERAELAEEVEVLEADELDEQLDRAEARAAELADELEELEENLEQLRADHGDLAGELPDLERRLGELRTDRDHKKKRRTEILDNYGSRDQLEGLGEKVAGEIEALEREKKKLETLVADEVEPTREQLEQAEKEAEDLEETLDERSDEIRALKVEIETITGEGARRKLDELQAERAQKERRREKLRVRAGAAKLLSRMVESYRERQTRQLAGPIRTIVDDWLRELTEQRHDHLRLDETLKPAGVEMAQYDEPLPFSELSFGTREQAHVLLRLALAVLLSEDERHTVILDDRLLNSDPRRHTVMNRILGEVSEDCQILLATCNDTPYAGLDARQIQVPRSGRIEEP